MLAQGLSQSSLAERLGVSREAVSQWLRGKKVPRPAKLLGLGKLLGLPFKELVLEEIDVLAAPQVAYRTNRKKKVKEQDLGDANDMGEGLRLLSPYLPPPSVTEPLTFAEPSVERPFVRQAAQYLRKLLATGTDGKVELDALIAQIVAQDIYLIPVLWGPNGHDGLKVRLPAERRTFIYINLDKKWTDFRFWLLHEWTHVLSPQMESNDSEVLADLLPAEVLYPESSAHRFLKGRSAKVPESHWIVGLMAEAQANEISSVTVWKQVLVAAAEKQTPIPDLDIYPAEGNRLRSTPTVASMIFDSETPEVGRYLDQVGQTFQTPVFGALARMIKEKGVGPSFVERILKVPLGDAGGIYRYLSSR